MRWSYHLYCCCSLFSFHVFLKKCPQNYSHVLVTCRFNSPFSSPVQCFFFFPSIGWSLKRYQVHTSTLRQTLSQKMPTVGSCPAVGVGDIHPWMFSGRHPEGFQTHFLIPLLGFGFCFGYIPQTVTPFLGRRFFAVFFTAVDNFRPRTPMAVRSRRCLRTRHPPSCAKSRGPAR